MSTSIANAASAANEENERTIRREKINAAIRYTVLIIVGFLMLYPLLWMFTAAMKPNHEIFSSMSLIPSEWSLEGFINGWKTGTEFTFGHYILNTFFYVLPKVFFTVVSSTIVAYAFARFEIPWKKFWFATLIASILLPQSVLLIPQYIMFREMGLLDSYLPLYLPLAFATQGFFVFMLVQFLRGVPTDMEEAAMIDGCNSFQVLWHVVVPVIRPAIISVALFQFMWSVNDFLGPLIYVSSVEKYPIALALKMSIDVTEGAKWNEILAMASIAIIPSIVVFFMSQKYFIEGAASSGIKG
ncbi:carbohydrate ABC transporter permease [Vibrio plantisponsor]|jgi:oligogalacturonide transport system permease protein|uniref:Carbohydrate ABC transporter permease n=1 Tax=Vibrio plantisponsor TaxID=664643 RepID=A0ABU4IR77_9VIBR|nr:carbohydrate ABC transporter permease [Vibrio plantisponsor]MDW6019965.1 carbohydrate ABC transporter permease [Vibrio plantisponsor]NNM42105.1 carbohydrate ABC transporter permease [Vibrio plantisponsor]PNH86809.1 sugar ABC transporter permease [Vibrio diazotrophicus]